MSDMRRDQSKAQRRIPLQMREDSLGGAELYDEDFMHAHPFVCEPGTAKHCLTCSDEALPVKVLQVNQENGLALVMVNDQAEEIDVTLVEDVAPGDTLLVHGGVAIANLEKHTSEVDDDQ